MNKLGNSNRLFIVPFVVVLVLGLILMTAVLPMVKMNPKEIPIGLVVADEGDMGATLAQRLLENAPELVKFNQYDSVEQVEAAMNEREVYGALVLPTDFSSKVTTLQTDSPEKAAAEIYVNEGANTTVATLVQTALTNMVNMLNTQLSTQMMAAVQAKTDEMKEQLVPILQAQGEETPLAQVSAILSPIQPSKVQDFANPIQAEVIKVHPAEGLSNAPVAFLTITWFTSLIGAVMLYLVGNKRVFASKADKLKFNILQSLMPIAYAIFAGYVATWYSTWLLGFELEYFNRVALYIALCIAAFIFMIFATLRWLKLPSIAIFVLLMFFSMSAAQLAPEMMPAFYRDYVATWLPLRIYADGLREVLFYSHDIVNQYSTSLIWVFVVALIVVWIKNFVEKIELKQS